MARERSFKVLKKILTLGKIIQIKKEGCFSEVKATKVDEDGKTKEGLLVVLGVENKVTGLLNVLIST